MKFSFLHNTPKRIKKENLQFRDVEDTRVLYKISDRAKRIALRVNPQEREVIVTVPGKRALDRAKRFVREKRDWIDVQLETLPEAQPFKPDQPILFKGELYALICPSERGRPIVDDINREIRVPGFLDTFGGRVRRLLIREAREALTASTHKYAHVLDKQVAKISVRDTRSRWGSCITRQGKGHISYSWRLVCAPPFVLDYVCAHEAAHMIHDHHGPEFWDLTHQICAETNRAKKWLKTNGAFLHAVGAEH